MGKYCFQQKNIFCIIIYIIKGDRYKMYGDVTKKYQTHKMWYEKIIQLLFIYF